MSSINKSQDFISKSEMRASGLPAHFHCGSLFGQKSQYNVDQRTCEQLYRHRRTSTDFDPSFSAFLRQRSAIPLHVWNDTNINPEIRKLEVILSIFVDQREDSCQQIVIFGGSTLLLTIGRVKYQELFPFGIVVHRRVE